MSGTTPHIQVLSEMSGVVSAKQLTALGVPRVQLSRWVASGQLRRLSRGLYALPSYAPNENASLIEVAQKAPSVTFCLLTALRFHNLTTQAPFEVWIAIGPKARAPKMDYPALRVWRFSGEALPFGVEVHPVDGVNLRVTSVAKTVADCFKFRNKIGLDVALEALQEAVQARRVSMDELWRAATVCRMSKVMRPYLESLP